MLFSVHYPILLPTSAASQTHTHTHRRKYLCYHPHTSTHTATSTKRSNRYANTEKNVQYYCGHNLEAKNDNKNKNRKKQQKKTRAFASNPDIECNNLLIENCAIRLINICLQISLIKKFMCAIWPSPLIVVVFIFAFAFRRAAIGFTVRFLV